MFVITVVPLKRGITVETLSYFSSEPYQAGAMVTIPLRNTSTIGLVTGSTEVSAAKTALRAATFSLRKLPPQDSVATLGTAYQQTARALSAYYAAPLGMVLYNLLSPELRNGEISLPHTHHVETTSAPEPHVFQSHKTERYRAYRSLVRETFAHCGSVLLVVPSSVEATDLHEALSPGIEDRVIMLTTASTKSELKRAYGALEDFSKTKLIIATSSYAVIERHDITLVIVESARSGYYRDLVRPYLDYRDVLVTHARYTGRKIILADTLPRTEEESLRRQEVYQTQGETPRRIELPSALKVIDMQVAPDATKPFSLFSDEVIDVLKEVRKKKGHAFLFAARRGLAPVVTCVDCGFIFRSKESGAPYSLIRTTKDGVEERWFVCSTSGERRRASDTCESCGSWRLRERGIGIQHVYDELHKLFPQTPITLFDHVTARTYKKATFLRDTFYKTKGSLLLGTHMTLPYLTKPVDVSVVVNMDALLATPTWRLEEDNLGLLLHLREMTQQTVYVQTRTQTADVLNHARHGTVEQFYTEELALRKKFAYPPYATFIHLTWQGAPDLVKNIESEIMSLLADWTPSVYQNPTAPPLHPIMYGLIRVPKESWPNQKLSERLRSLPPSVRVIINPDKIV